MAAALLFLVGVAAVVGGAELVVRGGARLAARLGIPPLIIGLTVVAIGTSFPELAVGIDNIHFQEADARALPFADASFDVVVFDSTLSHVPAPERAVAEAFRVLRPIGRLAVFDGDYATTTVALGDHDPLQACVDAMVTSSVTDSRLVRHLQAITRRCGFDVVSFRSHGFVETGHGVYMLSIVDRGADVLRARGEVDEETAAALKAEARRRVDAGTFFGHIAYASLVASKASDARL